MPERCTTNQERQINRQLSPDQCFMFQDSPYLQRCSFSRVSACPTPTWLHEFHREHAFDRPFLSLFVGCNKGIDAVNALRMGSNNAKYDVASWSETLSQGTSPIEAGYANSSCDQFGKKQVDVASSDGTSPSLHPRQAHVYCFEPLSVTYHELNRTAQQMQWGDAFIVEQAAFGGAPGILNVPSMGVEKGLENNGLEEFESKCHQLRDEKLCDQVPIYTIDDYVSRKLPHDRPIDYLSIDVEGYDYDVIMASRETLPRIHYLEFEYSWVGPWKDQSLQDLIEFLEDEGFACYWPSDFGALWRITGCWQHFYRVHVWSNVACVNVRAEAAAPLARKMEETFLATLEDNSIRIQ